MCATPWSSSPNPTQRGTGEMVLTALDWTIIGAYFLGSLLIGLYYTRRAGRSTEEFFLSARTMPWWLAGTSMVATTFAADTPLAVSGMVARHGVAGNWLWWNFVFSGMLTVFFFASLWRRAGVMTDVEFIEIRYAGKPAAFLRGFRALYMALPINCVIMGWVNLGMAKVVAVSMGWEKWQAVTFCLIVSAFYAIISGYWGVVVTDFFQFIVAMAGSIALAYFAVHEVGGITGLKEGLARQFGDSSQILSFYPDVGSAWMPVATFMVYIGVNWWAAWYPGAEPGGGGYIAQRIFSAKDERHSLLATLWFNIAHYALRPWPWILVALAAMVLYPNLKDPETGYVQVMVDHLPVGFRGLLLAGFAAAYMSTISTHMNWGASYMVNDFYRRFLVKDGAEKHYVLISRMATVLILIASGVVTAFMSSVEGAWKILLAFGAGTGLVYILRWYWWRINAWSEIAAMIASFIVSMTLQFGMKWNSDDPLDFAKLMVVTVLISTACWLLVTFLTPAESEEILISFYRRVHPGGRLWKPISSKIPDAAGGAEIGMNLLDWLLGCLLIYLSLFAIGKFVLGFPGSGLALLAAAVVCGALIYRHFARRGWEVLG